MVWPTPDDIAVALEEFEGLLVLFAAQRGPRLPKAREPSGTRSGVVSQRV
jgi:hypothetical protein